MNTAPHLNYLTKFTREMMDGKENPERDPANRKRTTIPGRRALLSKQLGFPINAVPNRKTSARLDIRVRYELSRRGQKSQDVVSHKTPGSLNPRKKA